MSDLSRVQQLVDEVFDSERTPEEVCADCPELLAEVRQRWLQIRLVEAELTAMFPTPEPRGDADTQSNLNPAGELPRIIGYEVETILGRGGMGIVYKARHLRLNRSVAIKMLLPGAYAGLEERERFFREAEAVAGLRHANLVQIHDVGDHDGRPYFSLEYVEGGSLAQKLLGAPLRAHQAAALLVTLADAVQMAHHGGIVHRDLKPANILLTADGTPKIADFGLARHFDTGSGLTRTGDRVGTPSYMAPEQAMGKNRSIGPAVDIYSLGAILYELLTGRPPFRGETSAETEMQVIHQDPVPPSRLNSKVPRDLETICLKCLRKEPEARYTNAAALADDLRRFLEGRPIYARPLGWGARLWRWARRNPAAAALSAGILLVVMALVSGGVWLAIHEAQRRQTVEADLREVTRLQERAQWTEARAALERAEARLGGSGPGDLRQRLSQARRNLDLVVQLDQIHLNRVSNVEEEDFNSAPVDADQDYELAFREAGLGQFQDDADSVAARVQRSAIHGALVAALDDWAVSVTDQARRHWVLEVARRADPDPEGWRDRARDPSSWEDGGALAKLVETAPVAEPSVQLLLALGDRWHAHGGDATGFFRHVQREHPADFWANFTLANALKYRNSGEAISYFRVALAIRPGAAITSYNLGDVLKFQGWLDEALEYYRKALAIEPKNAKALTGFGNLLKDMGRLDEALAYFQQAVRDDPKNVWAHINLGKTLKLTGRLEEALVHYEHAITLDPKNPASHEGIRSVRMRLGQGEEVRVAWRKALDGDPPEYQAWLGYPALCLFLGQEEDYRRARGSLLGRFSSSTDPFVAERIGRGCLLLPAPEEELGRVAELIDRGVAAGRSKPDWAFPYFLFSKALAAYRQGQIESAIELLQGEASLVPGPAPGLVLAMAQHHQGRKGEARHTLATAVVTFDWNALQADNPRTWICHVLRREAEKLILPDLPAFMDGKYQPQDNDERLAFLGTCQFTNRTHAMARLYSDAFAVNPRLADDLVAGHRYNAARAAAMAASSQGADASSLGREEKARLREQARQWLQADLAAWTKRIASDSETDRNLAKKILTRWQIESDLAEIRDLKSLQAFSQDEREECLALWREVADLIERKLTNK
jgi:serine/threonine-protein kinase